MVARIAISLTLLRLGVFPVFCISPAWVGQKTPVGGCRCTKSGSFALASFHLRQKHLMGGSECLGSQVGGTEVTRELKSVWGGEGGFVLKPRERATLT